MPIQESTDIVQLFGGAIECRLPSRFKDISEIREIPDNQEVYCDVHSDQSIMFDLLSLEENVADQDSLKFHFEQIENDNDAEDAQITQTIPLTHEHLPNFPEAFKGLVIGQQKISKFNENARNIVNIYMCLIRLRNVGTDIVIVFNDPVHITQGSSSAASAAVTASNPALNLSLFQDILKSFKINDFSLFG